MARALCSWWLAGRQCIDSCGTCMHGLMSVAWCNGCCTHACDAYYAPIVLHGSLIYYVDSHAISHSGNSAAGSMTEGHGAIIYRYVRIGVSIIPAAIMPACHLLAWYMLTSSQSFCGTHAWRIAANQGPTPVLQAAAASARCALPAAARCGDASSCLHVHGACLCLDSCCLTGDVQGKCRDGVTHLGAICSMCLYLYGLAGIRAAYSRLYPAYLAQIYHAASALMGTAVVLSKG
jgi:hypothetical protein